VRKGSDHGGFFIPKAKDVTFSARVTSGPMTTRGNTFYQKVTITNTGTVPFDGPVNLMLYNFNQRVTFRAESVPSMVGSSPLETGNTPLGRGVYVTMVRTIR
jgi:hypothetical protein